MAQMLGAHATLRGVSSVPGRARPLASAHTYTQTCTLTLGHVSWRYYHLYNLVSDDNNISSYSGAGQACRGALTARSSDGKEH